MGPSQTNPNFTTFQRDIIHDFFFCCLNLTFLKRILFFISKWQVHETRNCTANLNSKTEKSGSLLNNDEDNKIKIRFDCHAIHRFSFPFLFFFFGSIYFISASKFAAYYNQFSLKKKSRSRKTKKAQPTNGRTRTDCGAFFHTFRIESGPIRAELTDGQGRGENVSIFQFNINHCFLVLLIVGLNLFPASASLDRVCSENKY